MRMIDADELRAEISKWPDSVMYKDWVQSAIATAPTVPAYGQWESVEDNSPGNEYDFVLAYKPYLHEMGGSGMIVEHPWFVRMNNTYKYWMPLPEPPEEVRDNGAHIES